MSGDKASGRGRAQAGERWLGLVSGAGSSLLQAYRYLYSRLPVSHYDKVILVFGDARIAVLSE